MTDAAKGVQQLSGLDATFLYLETPEMPMHVGALHLFTLPEGKTPGPRFVTRLRQHLAERLEAVPVLTRKLRWLPLNLANPVWVPADPDLRWHVVEHRLPQAARHGGGMAELQAAVATLHMQRLDRERPLWRFHVFEGLGPDAQGRRQVALYTQLHHAAVDGQAAVALANALLDPTPDAPGRAVVLRRSRQPAPFAPGMTEMLRGVIGQQAQKVAALVKELPLAMSTLKAVATSTAARSKLLGGPGGSGNVTLAPRLPLNSTVGGARRFATATLPLPEVKALARAHGASINDIVLMLVSTALRRFYARRKLLPRKSLIAAVPVSLRGAGDPRADNQASMSLVSLGTQIADPQRRLAHLLSASGAMKKTMGTLKPVLPTDFPSLGLPWLLETAAALYGRARVAERVPQVANLVVSNVPGPPVPLYMAGARMRSCWPASIVVHGLALNITVQSFDESLDFGLMADAQAMPEVAELAEALRIAFDDLQLMPRPGEPDADEGGGQGLIGRATRQLGDSVGGMVDGAVSRAGRVTQQVVGAALSGAVTGAVSKTLGTRTQGAPRAPGDASRRRR
jgi:diacylglycerol O-acyltransferase / wax synthase